MTEKITTVLIEDLTLQARLGIYEHEKTTPQTVVISLALDIVRIDQGEEIGSTVCYETICNDIRAHLQAPIELAETLAEDIAKIALTSPLTRLATVTVKKPEAIPDTAAVGVSITRSRPDFYGA